MLFQMLLHPLGGEVEPVLGLSVCVLFRAVGNRAAVNTAFLQFEDLPDDLFSLYTTSCPTGAALCSVAASALPSG